MRRWGAPSEGEGYNQSKMTIDIDRCFETGTEEHTAMWKDLKRIADHLTELRDANIPVLCRPMHEFDGGWFWYGKGGGERFIRLWRSMFDYFVKERKLDNLIWVLCHCAGPPRPIGILARRSTIWLAPTPMAEEFRQPCTRRLNPSMAIWTPIPYHGLVHENLFRAVGLI